jgi:hypothetical protein
VIKEFGLGLAVAVTMDAFLIRITIVPAIMSGNAPVAAQQQPSFAATTGSWDSSRRSRSRRRSRARANAAARLTTRISAHPITSPPDRSPRDRHTSLCHAPHQPPPVLSRSKTVSKRATRAPSRRLRHAR